MCVASPMFLHTPVIMDIVLLIFHLPLIKCRLRIAIRVIVKRNSSQVSLPTLFLQIEELLSEKLFLTTSCPSLMFGGLILIECSLSLAQFSSLLEIGG